MVVADFILPFGVFGIKIEVAEISLPFFSFVVFMGELVFVPYSLCYVDFLLRLEIVLSRGFYDICEDIRYAQYK